MRFFKIKKDKPGKRDNPAWEKIADIIAGIIIFAQRKFVAFMQARTSNWPAKKQKLMLILFCLCGLGWNVYIIKNAFCTDAAMSSMRLESIHIPAAGNRQTEEILKPDWYSSSQEHKKIQVFKHYMDSLHTHQRVLYDSIMRNRPGLIDSIKQVENLYQSQK